MFNGCCGRQQDPMMGFGMPMPAQADGCGCTEREIVEPAINKCVEREFYHKVPHACYSFAKIL